MPFRSKAQQRLMFAKESRGELKRGTARKWAHETPNMRRLPERVGKRKSQARASRRRSSRGRRWYPSARRSIAVRTVALPLGPPYRCLVLPSACAAPPGSPSACTRGGAGSEGCSRSQPSQSSKSCVSPSPMLNYPATRQSVRCPASRRRACLPKTPLTSIRPKGGFTLCVVPKSMKRSVATSVGTSADTSAP